MAFASREQARSELDLAALVDTHSLLLFRIANSVLRNPAEAEDVVQEVFLRVLKRPSSLDRIRDTRVWLGRIAWNLALDRRRRIRPAQFDDHFAETLVATSTQADRALQDVEQMRNVLNEIERLPKAEREVLLLSAVEELGTPGIAEVLGRSESAVRALLSRARAHLRERLRNGERS